MNEKNRMKIKAGNIKYILIYIDGHKML